MKTTTIILLCTVMTLIGWHLGWHVRGIGETRIIEREVDRRLDEYLGRWIRSGLLTVNDGMLHRRGGTNMPAMVSASTR
jgi:hypothetical protein